MTSLPRLDTRRNKIGRGTLHYLWVCFCSPVIVIGCLNGLAIISATITSLILVRGLPKADYGQLVYFYTSSSFLRVLINFGLGLSISRDISSTVDFERLQIIVHSTGTIRTITVICAFITVLLVGQSTQQPILVYVAWSAMVASLADFVFAVIAGLRSTWRVSLMTVIQPLVYLFLALVVLASNNVKPQFLMLGYISSFVLMIVLGIILVATTQKICLPRRHHLQMRYIKSILSFVAISYLVSLLSQAWSTVAVGQMGWLGRFEESAEFGIVFTIVSLPISISGPTILTTFFPQLSNLFAANQHKEMLAQIRNTVELLAIPFIWITAMLFVFSETIIINLFGEQYVSIAPTLRLVSLICPVAGLLPLFTYVLFAINRPLEALAGLSAQFIILLVLVLASAGGITLGMLSKAVLLSSLVGLLIQSSLVMLSLRTWIYNWRLLIPVVIGVGGAALLRYGGIEIGTSFSTWQLAMITVFTIIHGITSLILRRITYR